MAGWNSHSWCPTSNHPGEFKSGGFENRYVTRVQKVFHIFKQWWFFFSFWLHLTKSFLQILGDKSCEVIFPKIARWILRVNGTTFISPSGWLLGAQCTSKNVVDWPLKMTQPFGTRYVYGWNIQIRSAWHCEGEEICIISGFLWGAHWGSQHLGFASRIYCHRLGIALYK